MKYQEFEIKQEYKSIYHFLKSEDFSENFIANLRKDWGNLVVNNEIVNIRKPLKIADILKINSNPNNKTSIMHCIIPLDIVYEDEYYLVINKPSGISCMPSRSYYSHNLAGAICKYMSAKDENFVLRMINRLDKDTAGIIVVAKDSIAQNRIKNIEKKYYAVCHGEIKEEKTIDYPIKTISNAGINERKRIISTDGKEATTFISPIRHNGTHSLIKLALLHGRTHQIRLHLSSISHPLVGDELYGVESDLISHTALICKEISFLHPYLNKKINLEIDFPDDFKTLLKKTCL